MRRVPRGEAIAPPRRSRFVGATGAFALAFTALLALAPRPQQPPWIARDDGAHRWIVEHARPRVARAYAPTHADTVGDDEGGNAGHLEGGEEGWGHRAEDTSGGGASPRIAGSRCGAATFDNISRWIRLTWVATKRRAVGAAAQGPR